MLIAFETGFHHIGISLAPLTGEDRNGYGIAMKRSPEAELAILLELLSAQEALDEHRRRMSSRSVPARQRADDPASGDDALAAIERALIKANGGPLQVVRAVSSVPPKPR
jgi:hypothetical protein